MMSLGLPLAPADWSGLSLAVGVSVAESLQPELPAVGNDQAARIGLKWPNDLWLGGSAGDRKLGGILVETASFVAPQPAAAPAGASTARYVVVGIGINVMPRSAEGMSLPPGSLQDVEPGLDAPTALLRIVPALVAMLQSFEGYGFAPMQARFARRDVLQGRAVALSDGQAGTAHDVVSGIGFLGAGVIMREEGNVRGLNTAATLWGSAAVGACAGADMLLEALLGATFVLASNTLLRPVVDRINRQPMDTLAVEVTNTVYVIARQSHQKQALHLLENALEAADLPTRDLKVHAFGDDAVEIEAVLAANAVDGEHLERLTRQLAEQPFISQAFWGSEGQ